MGSLRFPSDLVRAAFGLEENIGVVFGICFALRTTQR